MIWSRYFRNAVAAGLVILFSTAALCAETTDEVSGSDLLRTMREKNGGGTKPSYAQREAEAKRQEAEAKRQAVADAKSVAEPNEKKAPGVIERPIPPLFEPEQPVKPAAIVTKPAQVEAPVSDELLKTVPAESLFCVRINNFDYTINMIDQFLAGISPIPMVASMMVRTQLANVLGSPQLNGLNMGGSFIVFGTILSGESTGPDMANIFIGILAPVVDYKQFISGNPNCGQPDEKGVSKITGQQLPAMLVTQVDNNCALVTPIVTPENYDRLVAIAKSISGGKSAGLAGVLDAAEAKLSKNEPLWAYGNVQLAPNIFSSMVFSQLEKMKMMMGGVKPSGQEPIESPATLMKEIKSVSLTINPKPKVLNITKTISAVPDTNMAKIFIDDASSEQENKLLGYLEDGAAINFGFKTNTPFFKMLIDNCAGMAAANTTDEDATQMKTLAADCVAALSGAMVGSFSINAKSKPPLAVKFLMEAKDTDKLSTVIKEAVDLWKSGDSNSPQGRISTTSGGGIDCKWSMVDGLCACVFAGDAPSIVSELTNKVKAGCPKELADEMKAISTLLPGAEKADFVCTLNYIRLLKMFTTMMPIPIPQMDIPTKSNIVLAGKVGDGKFIINVAVPKEHLAEIMSAMTMIQQQMMQQMPKPAGPTPQPALWTCPMHPQVQQEQKGLCPVCGAELVPVQKQ